MDHLFSYQEKSRDWPDDTSATVVMNDKVLIPAAKRLRDKKRPERTAFFFPKKAFYFAIRQNGAYSVIQAANFQEKHGGLLVQSLRRVYSKPDAGLSGECFPHVQAGEKNSRAYEPAGCRCDLRSGQWKKY